MYGSGRSVSGPRTFTGFFDGSFRRSREKQRNRREAHQRTVSCGILVGRARMWLPSRLKFTQSSVNGIPYVEDSAVAAKVGVLGPANIPLYLVNEVELPCFDKALCQAEGH